MMIESLCAFVSRSTWGGHLWGVSREKKKEKDRERKRGCHSFLVLHLNLQKADKNGVLSSGTCVNGYQATNYKQENLSLITSINKDFLY